MKINIVALALAAVRKVESVSARRPGSTIDRCDSTEPRSSGACSRFRSRRSRTRPWRTSFARLRTSSTG